jgi:hypothetical protein
MSLKKALRGTALIAAPFGFFAGIFSAPAMAETHGYVISWFATATYNLDFKGQCPEDRNGGLTELGIRNLMAIGLTREEAVKVAAEGGGRNGKGPNYRKMIVNRAKVKGMPDGASIYNYPDAVEDPNIETVTGKYAYGFDLGGASQAAKFEDPDTHEKVDNQLWRAVGCTESFRATPPVMPYPEELAWQAMTDSAPAWIIQVSGEDLSKDGKVTITIDRATRHPGRDATGAVLSNATYVIDPSNTRSHNVVQGEIKDGVISIDPSSKIHLEGEMPYYSEIGLTKAHWRVKQQPDGKLVGHWGGYMNWTPFVYMFTARSGNNADTIGIYHAVKKMADADPDPKTGQNRSISATWRMEAVPAFIASLDGKILATPVEPALAPGEKVAENTAGN